MSGKAGRTEPVAAAAGAARSPFAAVEDALAAIARGEPVVVVDDAARENEGDVIMAAELVTPEQMAFIVRCGGLVCVALEGGRLDDLALPLMVPPDDNSDSQGTSFTVSVDAFGTTTGISAADRALHRQDSDRPRHGAGRSAPPGSHLPAARPARRRAQASRSYRGRGRPGPAGRPSPRRRALRGRQG